MITVFFVMEQLVDTYRIAGWNVSSARYIRRHGGGQTLVIDVWFPLSVID